MTENPDREELGAVAPPGSPCKSCGNTDRPDTTCSRCGGYAARIARDVLGSNPASSPSADRHNRAFPTATGSYDQPKETPDPAKRPT